MTDIAFIAIPKLDIKGPILAITQLKSCVNNAGFKAKCYDFNIWLYKVLFLIASNGVNLCYTFNCQQSRLYKPVLNGP